MLIAFERNNGCHVTMFKNDFRKKTKQNKTKQKHISKVF